MDIWDIIALICVFIITPLYVIFVPRYIIWSCDRLSKLLDKLNKSKSEDINEN